MDPVADVVAIQQLIAHYPVAVDSGDFDRLDDLFTPDATIDYSAFGGPSGTPAEVKRFLRDSLPLFRRTQHLMGLPAIEVSGDRATARTPCSNPMVLDNGDGTSSVMLIGLWYDDEFVRSADGWRFSARRQDRCHSVVGLADTPLGPQ
jgi:ketosteroid isomerase-like protein